MWLSLPSALKVLGSEVGEEISQQGVAKQAALLNRIDTFNLSRQREHLVFSILRSSFDSLLEQDQLLFLLVPVLLEFFSRYNFTYRYTYGGVSGAIVEWLRIVDGDKDNESFERRLEVLKRKSVLQSFGS